MEELILTEPSGEYAEDIWSFRQEILESGDNEEDMFAGCLSLDTSSSAEEWSIPVIQK